MKKIANSISFSAFKKKFIKFWQSDNSKISLVRDVVIALSAVLIVLILLWSYTGQWFAAPMVAIESGSMEHPNSPFGRFGTIDAGDMVLVQKVYSKNDLVPHGGNFGGAQASNGDQTYGDYGDVIIYYPDGDMEDKAVIHRVMFWVDVYEKNGEKTYTINDLGIYNQTTLYKPEYGIKTYHEDPISPNWSHSGFLTKGDNNDIIDQAGGISYNPVKLEWISGKARLEIPWLGTINLFFEDLFSGRNTVGNVHEDSLICLVILIVILISIPIILDIKDYIKDKKNQEIH